MSNRIKLISFTVNKDTVEKHIKYIKIVNDSADGRFDKVALEIETENDVQYSYPLTSTNKVSFKVESEKQQHDGKDTYVYSWKELPSNIAQTNGKMEVDLHTLDNIALDVSKSSLKSEWMTFEVNVIGSDDIRIGIMSASPSLGEGTEIGFSMGETGRANWLIIEFYFPKKQSA